MKVLNSIKSSLFPWISSPSNSNIEISSVSYPDFEEIICSLTFSLKKYNPQYSPLRYVATGLKSWNSKSLFCINFETAASLMLAFSQSFPVFLKIIA